MQTINYKRCSTGEDQFISLNSLSNFSGLVTLCNVVSVDTLIPPIDTLHLPSLCASNVPPTELS